MTARSRAASTRPSRLRWVWPLRRAYLLRRVGQAVFVLWAAYTVSFFVLYALPADPVTLLVGGEASDVTEEQIDALRARLGLDQPLIVQYLTHLFALVRGDLGSSIVTGRPVSQILFEAIGPTAQIAGLGLLIAVIFGTLIAVAANYVRTPALRSALLSLPPLGVAAPSFWLGLLLIQLFAFQLQLFPASGATSFSAAVLPAVTLAIPTGAAIAQLLSKSLHTTLDEAYIDTAVAKGATRSRVQLRHALRNAALPALTMTGLLVGGLFSGAVVTETVFSRPGLGRITASAVQSQDIPVVQGIVLTAALLFTVTTLIVDLIYPLVDPRLRARQTSPAKAPEATLA